MVFDRSLGSSEIADRAVTEVAHNQTAAMLRNGLAVVGFAALEDFIRTRTSEVALDLGRTGVRFDQLTDKLQKASTYGAIKAIDFQIKRLDSDSDKISLVQREAKRIYSTSQAAYELTPFVFGFSESNLNSDSIKETLSAFGVDQGWDQMAAVSARVGMLSLPLRQAFENARMRRHNAAHVFGTITPQVDLQSYVREALSIAISFDVLISAALQKYRCLDAGFITGSKKLMAADIDFFAIRFSGGAWKLYPSSGGRAKRKAVDLAGIHGVGLAHARAKNAALVVFNESGQLRGWYPAV